MKIKIKNPKTVAVTTLLCLVPILFGVAMWDQLPDIMPTHFGLNNEANGFMSKPIAVFLLPCIVAALELFCVVITSLDPKSENIAQKSFLPILWMMPTISWLCSVLTYGAALGYKMNIGAIMLIFLGVVFLVLGNYIPKNARNYTVGVKTPWALEDEDNWLFANRICGISMAVCGGLIALIGIIGLFLAKTTVLYIIALCLILIAVLIPIVASYLHYRKHHGNDAA